MSFHRKLEHAEVIKFCKICEKMAMDNSIFACMAFVVVNIATGWRTEQSHSGFGQGKRFFLFLQKSRQTVSEAQPSSCSMGEEGKAISWSLPTT
jgi:hypothetical protein